MSTQEQTTTTTEIPAGTWVVDPVHSSIGFAVKHNTVETFKGKIGKFDIKLDDGRLAGTAEVASIQVEDEQMAGHLQTPDFFDAEQFPELRFVSSTIQRASDRISVTGDLTIRGNTAQVELSGTIAGPAVDGQGKDRIGLDLETTVNRHDFGVSWNADLPDGRVMVDDDVTITANLALVQA
jgi:polyisoprenoid-binding protein YceI